MPNLEEPDRTACFLDRAYRALLLAYPKEFRRAYGPEMARVFRDACREERRRGGTTGLIALWARTLSDLARTATRERRTTMRDKSLSVLVPVALSIGLGIALVDSSPGWDDTGISAAAVFCVCGLLCVLHPRRAWVWALCVGSWIPAFTIAANPENPNYGSLLALVFCFAGAYAGALARRTAAGGTA